MLWLCHFYLGTDSVLLTDFKHRQKYFFCQCGNIFEFKTNLINREKILLEKFCPFCGTENPHHSRIQEDFGLALVRAKKHLGCPRCLKRAESYEHKFCSVCQHKLVAIVL